MKMLVIMLVMLGVVISASSCRMLKGAGEDIENAGDAVKDATN
jgi:predicted small secreted protein